MSKRKPPPGKPFSSAPPSTTASPSASQIKISDLLQKEEAAKQPSVVEMLQEMKQEMQQTKSEIMKGQRDLKEQMEKMQKDFSMVETKIVEHNQRIVGVEEKSAELEIEMGQVQKGVVGMENFMAKAEFERMSLYLRFQNVPELEDQDLKEVMCTMLAEYLGKDKKEVQWDMDQVYRVNSAYAKTHNVPREVHVKFIRRITRDEVLQAQRRGSLKYQDREITILKQVPRKIRELRRKYSSLSKKLFENGIWFRWLFPEGMIIFWKEEKIKIKSAEEADAFLKERFPEDKTGDGGGGAVGGVGVGGPGAAHMAREEETIAARLRSQKQ